MVLNTSNECCTACGELVYATTGRLLRVHPFKGPFSLRCFCMSCADKYLAERAKRHAISTSQLSLPF